MPITLDDLEREAFKSGLILRLQVRRPFNIWALKLVVAQKLQDEKIQILGEMKAWAYSGVNGLQLDTIRVRPDAPRGVGHLIWLSTMVWALENTPCKRARLLAIRDESKQHSILVRYFLGRGFKAFREVGSSPFDLYLRMIWGGAGLLMVGECKKVLSVNQRLWNIWNLNNNE